MNKHQRLRALRDFLENIPEDEDICISKQNIEVDTGYLLELYASMFTECMHAVAHGPGNQSVSYCEEVFPHTEHSADNGAYVWVDDDESGERIPRFGDRAGKRYSVAFDRGMWYR